MVQMVVIRIYRVLLLLLGVVGGEIRYCQEFHVFTTDFFQVILLRFEKRVPAKWQHFWVRTNLGGIENVGDAKFPYRMES